MTATPATTRKRARSQTTTAGSLSLLAVPKLKLGESVTSCPGSGSLRPATWRDDDQKSTGKHSPMPRASKQHAKDAASSITKGKENRPHGHPDQAKLAQHTHAGKTLGLTDVFSHRKQTLPAETAAAKMPRKVVTAKDNLPAPCFTSASPTQLSVHNVSGTSHPRVAAADEATTRTAELKPVPDKHSSGVCAGMTAGINGAEQALLAQDVPLACHTAINKRRCYCSPPLHPCAAELHDIPRKAAAAAVLVTHA